MKRQPFDFELITRCFLGGAKPREIPELRASSVRAQLRWWFRVLGGFSISTHGTLRKQEDYIFGVAAGDSGTAGKLRVQITVAPKAEVGIFAREQVEQHSAESYFLWPFAQEIQAQANPRACFAKGTKFEVRILWLGEAVLWPSIQALVAVFGHLGSLGTRGRRAMGALRSTSPTGMSLAAALPSFRSPGAITVFATPANSAQNATSKLADWLRGWRQHGQRNRTWDKHASPPAWKPIKKPATKGQGFGYARRDHNEGLEVLKYPSGSDPSSLLASSSDRENPAGNAGTTFRPALGLPIVQFFSSLGDANGRFPPKATTVNWSWSTNGGRFASPVLLRPHWDGSNWQALVIFLENKKWPNDSSTGKPRQVVLNGAKREVSLDLYDKMKSELENQVTTNSQWSKLCSGHRP